MSPFQTFFLTEPPAENETKRALRISPPPITWWGLGPFDCRKPYEGSSRDCDTWLSSGWDCTLLWFPDYFWDGSLVLNPAFGAQPWCCSVCSPCSSLYYRKPDSSPLITSSWLPLLRNPSAPPLRWAIFCSNTSQDRVWFGTHLSHLQQVILLEAPCHLVSSWVYSYHIPWLDYLDPPCLCSLLQHCY